SPREPGARGDDGAAGRWLAAAASRDAYVRCLARTVGACRRRCAGGCRGLSMKWCMRCGPFHSVAFVAIAISVVAASGPRAQQSDNLEASVPTSAARTVSLAPTVHPAVPSRPTDFWYVPESFPRTGAGRSESPAEKFARAARLIDGGDFAGGLPLLTGAD